MLVDPGIVDGRLLGPGLTIDEPFDIQQGVYLFDALVQHGPLLFRRLEQGKFSVPQHIFPTIHHWAASWWVPHII